MIVLGIETSCDETAAALVKDGRRVLCSSVASQVAVHRPFKGVVPELASRAHVERINEIIVETLTRPPATLSLQGEGRAKRGVRVDAIAVTTGPGLVGCLLVGTVTARMLAWVKGVPVIGVNHLEGHLFAGLVEHPTLKPPFLGLIVSGGHTELVIFQGYGRYEKLGATRDDAAGEAFDKVANLLGLPFPGGPSIDRMARKGNPAAVAFPRAWIPGTWDFSFSGIKTSVANYLKSTPHPYPLPSGRGEGGLTKSPRPPQGGEGVRVRGASIVDIAASFQEAVVDVLVKKTLDAAESHGLSSIVVGGGVAANSRLRAAFQAAARMKKRRVYLPDLSFCTDNAAMIAAAGYYKWKHGLSKGDEELKVNANLEIENWKN
jgi:N6-L-threonylcarbamoyladenine synthase